MKDNSTDLRTWYNKRAMKYRTFGQDREGIARYLYALKVAPINNSMNVIDLGCKTGSLLSILTQKEISINYHGIDISEVALEHFPKKHSSTIRISQKDIMDGIPEKDSWADRLYMLEVLEHIREPLRALEEISRVLKPDGVAVISTPNPYYWANIIHTLMRKPGREGHLSLFSWREISTLCDFSGLKTEGGNRTFELIPYSIHSPYKRGRTILIKAPTVFNSISYQYIIKRKS